MATLLMICVAVFGITQANADLYCAAESVEAVDGCVQLGRQWDEAFADDFQSDLSGWRVANYETKLVIGLEPEGETGTCFVVRNQEAQGDTAFEVTSGEIPVDGGMPYRFRFSWRSDVRLTVLSGHNGLYLTQLQWNGADGEAVGQTPLEFGDATAEWQHATAEGVSPDDAVSVVIRFGMDNPNIEQGGYVAIDSVKLDAPARPAAFYRRGMVLSRPPSLYPHLFLGETGELCSIMEEVGAVESRSAYA